MFHYMYHFDYGDYGNSQEHVAAIVLDVRMFALADKYFIAPLKKLSAEKFSKRSETEWDTASFAVAVAEVYEIVPEHEETLRNIVVRVSKEHAKDLLDDSKGYEEFNKVLREKADFAADISVALSAATSHTSCRRPAGCFNGFIMLLQEPWILVNCRAGRIPAAGA